RDARRSFELLALLRANSAIGLLSLVTGRIRELICARALMARGDARGIAAALGKADWQVRGHARNAGRFAEGELEGLLVECARADRALKTGADADATMAVLVAHICGVR
ncbi:MAG: DNA polymerase III subunit delta, partial [Paratractidigestivibacter faecalis]